MASVVHDDHYPRDRRGIVAWLIGKIADLGKLPRCDAQVTKDTLSDLNKQNHVNASHYNAITTLGAEKDEVLCKASLALRDGGTLEYNYRVFRDDSGTKVQITDAAATGSAAVTRNASKPASGRLS